MLEGYRFHKNEMSLKEYVETLLNSNPNELSSEEYQDYLEVTGMYDENWNEEQGPYDWFKQGDGEYLEDNDANSMLNNTNFGELEKTIIDHVFAKLLQDYENEPDDFEKFDLTKKQNIGICILDTFHNHKPDEECVVIVDVNSPEWKNGKLPEENPNWLYDLLIQIFDVNWVEEEPSIFRIKKNKLGILKRLAKEIKSESELNI